MEKKRQIINIVNFIRGFDSEPQPPLETYYTVQNQIKLIDKYNFKSTFLIQYDALQMEHFRELMLSLDRDRYEIGVWFEINKPLCEDAGAVWKGDREWNGHCDCGYAMAYNLKYREKMVDLVFEQFKDIFGSYPRVLGAWFYDTYTIRYAYEKYGFDALCNCKEQYGTDGYTLWGGYYGQAYYPSLNNVFIPAQSEDEQMNVPLFRMLGSDQVYQYEFGRRDDMSPRNSQSVITLEPVYHDAGGGLNEWVDWYLKENFNGECLSFGYAQAGQENSFGWQKMKDGLIYQFALFDKLVREGKIEIEQLGETGRWYSDRYKLTPASTITAHSAYDDDSKDTAWYCSRFYRVNLHGENGNPYIRDLHIFDDCITDQFENKNCDKTYAIYESLPAVDGFIYSGNGKKSGAYFLGENGQRLSYSNMSFEELNDSECVISFDDELKVHLSENEISIDYNKPFSINNLIARKNEFLPKLIEVSANRIVLHYLDRTYAINLSCGEFVSELEIKSVDNKIKASFELVR